MFQNGMSEEVQNYFVPGDEGSKGFHHPGEAGGLFRSQFVDPRAQMMGQHFPQFPYMAPAAAGAGMMANTPHKMPNGDWRNQLQLQQQHQQQQQFFEPPPQHQQQQQHFDQASFQALQMEKLRQQQQQQELLLGHGFGLQQQQQQQMMRPQMMSDNTFMGVRNTPMQTSPVYGLANNSISPFGAPQQMKSMGIFGGGGALQSESDAIDNLNDLFGGVEKLFADDPVQESKSAIPGLGSLGASLINGCEAELFGDGGSPFFGRGAGVHQYPPFTNNKPPGGGFQPENQLETGGFSQFQGPGSRMMTPPPPSLHEGHFQQQQQTFSPGLGQMIGQGMGIVPGGERWQPGGKTPGETGGLHGSFLGQQSNQMSRGTLQLFKDLDEQSDHSGQSGFQQMPMVESSKSLKAESQSHQPEGFRTGFSLGMLDGGAGGHQSHHKSDSPQVRFPPPGSGDGGLWLKDSEPAGNRLQPDRLLLDSSKQHQSKEVQNLLSFGNSAPGPGTSFGPHQSESSLRSRAYFEALEQQKQQQQQALHEAQQQHTPQQHAQQQAMQSYGNGGPGFVQAQAQAQASSGHEGGKDIGGLPWSITGGRQAQSQAQQEAIQRGNSTESPPVSFKTPVPKPVFGSLQSDKPSPLEATKRREDLFLSSGSVVASTSASSAPIMEGGSFASDKKSSSGSQVSEKQQVESEPPDRRTTPPSSIWPQLSQQQQSSHLSSGMVSTFQDISRRHFLKNDLRGGERQNITPRPESGVLFPGSQQQQQVKEKEEMMPPKVFESSALNNNNNNSSTSSGGSKPPASSSASIPVPFHQDKSQLLQSHLNSLSRVSSSDMQRLTASSREFPSSFTPPQHKPAESDSINDIVQLQQHQPRAGPQLPSPVPQLPGSGPQLPGTASQVPGSGLPQLPGSASQLPGSGLSQLPGSASQLPGSGLPQLPGSASQLSSPALQIPGSASQLPGPSPQLPGSASQLPGPAHHPGSVSQLSGLPGPAPKLPGLPGAAPQLGSASQLPGSVSGSTTTPLPVPTAQLQTPAVSSSPLGSIKPEQQQISTQQQQQQSASESKGDEKLPGSTPGSKSEVRDELSNENTSTGSLTTPEKSAASLSLLQSQQIANLLGLSGGSGANLTALKLAAASQQQILQVPKELQPLDLQQKLQAAAAQASHSQVAQVSLHQQRVQAALQAYALAKGGLAHQASVSLSDAGTAVGTGASSSSAPAALPSARSEALQAGVQAAVHAAQMSSQQAQQAAEKQLQQQLMLSTGLGNSLLPKKRKIEVQPLMPWRTTISQLTGALPPIRPADLQWAIETNRVPEKDVDEEFFSHDENLQFVGRARQRLKLTTQLMQNSLPPVPAAIMQSNTLDDRDSAMYVLARLSLGDACRMAGAEAGSKATLAATSELIVEGFKERIKLLEKTLQRMESLPLSLEFVKNTQYLDKVCVTNRLMRCHQELFPVNFTSQRRVQPIQRSCPQPLISALPIPDTFPEEFQLISL